MSISFDSNNKAAAAQVPEAERRFRPSFPANYEKLVIADFQWIAGERAKMRERWVSWLSGDAVRESSGSVANLDTERTGEVTEIEF